MDPTSYYASYIFWARIALLPGNLLLVAVLTRAFLRNRGQLGFLFLGIACLGFAYTTAFHLVSSLQHRFSIEIVPPGLWPLFVYAFFVVDPVAIVCWILGPIILARTYGQSGSVVSRSA
jgi:hypothetical protein